MENSTIGLLEKLKNEIAKEAGKNINEIGFNSIAVDELCFRYANEKARLSCKASLERAAQKAKTKELYDYSLERAEYVGTVVDKESILSESNIVL